MDWKQKRILSISIGIGVILIAAAFVIVYFAASGGYASAVSVKEYAIVEQTADGAYTARLDLTRIIADYRLPNPEQQAFVKENLELYPDLQILSDLYLHVAQTTSGDYEIVTQLQSEMSGAAIDKILLQNGLRLQETTWIWSAQEMQAAYRANVLEAVVEVYIPDYVRIFVDAQQNYSAVLDTATLLADIGWSSESVENQMAYTAILTLGIEMSRGTSSYDFSTTSTDENILESLLQGGVQMVGTRWTWSLEEVATRAELAESAEPSEEPTADPETDTTPKPEAEIDSNKNGALTTIKGVNQTAFRQSMRDAKLAHYGDNFSNSEVKYNYFIVAKTDDAAYANCFRIVYKVIRKSGGSAFIVVDAFNIKNGVTPAVSAIQITEKASESEAKKTDDFSSSDYTIYELKGGSMVFDDAPETPFDENGLVMAKALTETVTEEEFWNIPQTKNYTLYQALGYARNELFAQGGHQFSDTSNYGKHFSRYSWYQPTGEVSAGELGAAYPKTGKNITTIKMLESLIRDG